MAGAYVVCGGDAYLGVVVACAAGSVSYVLAKAAAVLPRRAVAAAGAGPEAMLLLSLALAAAHLGVAYRTSCRERRRMLVYRMDVEGVVSTDSPSALHKPSRLRIILDASNSRDFVRSCSTTVQGS